jgi:hypothetical protein
MPQVTLRTQAGQSSPTDIQVSVQDATFEYLMSSPAPTVRVSAYLEKDFERIEAAYAELFVGADCAYSAQVKRITPGSRTRQGLKLPCEMKIGEQLVIEVLRKPVAEPAAPTD